MNQDQVISSLVGHAIILTAHLANEVCIQTNGQFIVPENDYLEIVKEFQFRLSKRIMPVKSEQDLKEESKKYIAELIKNSTKGTEDGLSDGGDSKNSNDSATNT